jgi:hypothetical protein
MRNLNPSRVLQLIRLRLVPDFTPIAIGIGILAGLNLLTWVFALLLGADTSAFRESRDGYGWPALVILACFLTSSRAFHAMQSAKSATDWLLLPATTAEKYLATLLQTQVVVPVVTSLAGLLMMLVTDQFAFPREFGAWQMWGFFVVFNLLLFTGSTVFRKFAVLKTVATLVGFATALGLVALLFFKLTGGMHSGSSFFVGMQEGWDSQGMKSPEWQLRSAHGDTSWFLQTFWELGIYVFTPICALLFGYFRVAEKEAHHAVQ